MKKRETLYTNGWNVNDIAIVENNMQVFQEIKNRTTIQSSNSISGYISKNNEKRVSKRCLYSHVHDSITIVKIRKPPKCPPKKMWCVCVYIYTYTFTHTQSGIVFSHEKKGREILSFVRTQVDLSKISQRQISHSITYMWKLKKNVCFKVKLIETVEKWLGRLGGGIEG